MNARASWGRRLDLIVLPLLEVSAAAALIAAFATGNIPRPFPVVEFLILVIAAAAWLLSPALAGDGNATFISYAPGGKNIAYVTLDKATGIHPAHADEGTYINGDRVKVRMSNDGLYEIVKGPY